MTQFEVIATINSHLLEPKTLKRFASNGATILRLNGSHVVPADVGHYVKAVRRAVGKKVRILMDLPGNKIRTAGLSQPIPVRAGKTFELAAGQFNYPVFTAHLKAGNILWANDSLLKFRVESASDKRVVLYSFFDGQLSNGKGVHLPGRVLPIPFLFERDRQLIREAAKHGVDCAGLSFVRTAKDVREAKAALKGTGISTIVKIETQSAIDNIDAILAEGEEFLVDRGDLSCDVGIEKIDRLQKYILRRVHGAGKRMYFATQFMNSMVENITPLIAEVCGLADVIQLGVDGVQFSEETAIGKHPVEVLEMTRRIHAEAAPKKSHGSSAPVLWLTGRSGSGKTTIASKLVAELAVEGRVCSLIDGDDFRAFWGNDLGYTKEQRVQNLRGMIYTAAQAAKVFDVVIVSSLSPYRELRDLARAKLPNFHEIHVDCPIGLCRKRDPKGHYAKAAAGAHKNFIGVTEEFEAPLKPELVIRTSAAALEESVKELRSYLSSLGSRHDHDHH